MKKIICLEKPKMQNKHFFSFLGIPTYVEGGGGQAGWAKFLTFTENLFLGLP